MFVEGLGLDGRQGQWDISTDLLTLASQLTADMDFIASGTPACTCTYILYF